MALSSVFLTTQTSDIAVTVHCFAKGQLAIFVERIVMDQIAVCIGGNRSNRLESIAGVFHCLNIIVLQWNTPGMDCNASSICH